jgi:phage terminase large subunit
MFQRTTAINKILKLKKFVRGIQGGTSAGKTYGILPILIDKAIKNPGLEISVVVESMPHIKRGARRDFIKIMNVTGRWRRSQWNATDSIYTFLEGSIIEFFSADDDSKLKGARRDILYMNEANNMSFNVYSQLASRTKVCVYLDWNPTNAFWFHDELLGDGDTDFIVLTYEDNEGCPDSALRFINSAKSKGFFDPDGDLNDPTNIKNKYWANWYQVYGLGLVGRLEGLIFPEWETVGSIPDDAYSLGVWIDWGWNAPTACGELFKSRGKLYLREYFYKPGLVPTINDRSRQESVEQNLIDFGITKDVEILADKAEPKSIADLADKGWNVIPAPKYPGSVLDGIKELKRWQIKIEADSKNIIKERDNYKWKTHVDGKTFEEPIKAHDHHIDGIRGLVLFKSRRGEL